MPRTRPKPCLHTGCAMLVPSGKGGRCPLHTPVRLEERREKDRERGSSAKRGYSYRWQKARTTFLMREPLCKVCSTMLRPVEATEVDHIIPHRLGDAINSGDPLRTHAAQALFWDSSNWQALCGPCHSAKTVREDGGFGRTR